MVAPTNPPLKITVKQSALGDALNAIFVTKEPYKKLTRADQTLAPIASTVKQVKEAIEEVYLTYFKISLELSNATPINVTQLQIGDILLQDGRHYVVTQFVDKRSFTTWPRLVEKDQITLQASSIQNYKVIRSNLANLSEEAKLELNNAAKEIIESNEEFISSLKGDASTFRSIDSKALSDGYFQIGDILLLVDPTQISFTTQNGYQYFPTVRTQGNPKVPTMQQVKNISISLIFPNEDSINYQLLNIYAMYRRTPFVNIRNRDICNFFQDITVGGKEGDNRWLSVALESIQIQSVPGFPNTLQANITLLPFDSQAVSEGFKSLRSMHDVKLQQAVLYQDKELQEQIRKSESKLNEQEFSSSRFLDSINLGVKHSYNFAESLPFRSFYQSMIEDRKSVTDENGNPVAVYSSDNVRVASEYPIEKFRPTKVENRLRSYKTQANVGQSVELMYKYIDGNFTKTSKALSNAKLTEQQKIIDNLTNILNAFQSKEDLVRELVTSFYTEQDFYKEISYRFNRVNEVIPELLARHGVALEYDNVYKEITNLFGLISKGFLQKTGVDQLWAAQKDLRAIRRGAADLPETDYLGILNGIIYYADKNSPIDNDTGVKTAQQAIDAIWEWAEATDVNDSDKVSEQRKGVLADIINELRTVLQGGETSGVSVKIDPNYAAGGKDSPFIVDSLPIEPGKVIIDNQSNIIEGWSLVFANKYVPMNLLAFKYPYYQHIGSDDPSISLSVKSVGDSRHQDFKSELSLLSERIYETVKMVTLNTPELESYIDSRVTIKCKSNSIFSAFGIRKVVFESSNSTNIAEQPNCWNTTLSLTQSTFTISDYHSIESVPTNNRILREMGKLVGRIEFDNQDRPVVKRYSIRTDKYFDYNHMAGVAFSKRVTGATGIRRSNDPEFNEDLPLDDLLRLRFIRSKHGQRLLAYLKQVKAGADVDPTSIGVVGEEVMENYLTDLDKVTKGLIGIEVDEKATNAIRELVDQYPTFGNILKFIDIKLDDIIEKEINSLMTTIRVKKTFFDTLFQKFNIIGSFGTTGVGAVLATMLGLSFPLVGIALLAVPFAFFATTALAETAFDVAKNSAVDTFSSFFSNILDDFNVSVVMDVANKIMRDPVIKKKLVSDAIFGKEIEKTFNDIENNSRVNCYNDFDVPLIFDNGIRIAPDFYLFNSVTSDYEKNTYINEATGRYAKAGKLSLTQSLIEGAETLERFQEVIDQSNDITDKIKSSVGSVLLDGTGYQTDASTDASSINGMLGGAIQKLRDTYVGIARSNDPKLEDAYNKDANYDSYLEQYKKINPRKDAPNKKQWDAEIDAIKAQLSGSSKGLLLADTDKRKWNLLHAARMKTLLELTEMYNAINKYMNAKIGGGGTLFLASKNSERLKELRTTNKKLSKLDKNDKTITISKDESEILAVKKLHLHIITVLENAAKLNSNNFAGKFEKNSYSKDVETILKDIGKESTKGTSSPQSSLFLTLPGIKNLQVELYNKINFYVRLNTYLNENSTDLQEPNLDQFPELKFLEYWNYRSIEANDRKLQILQEFNQGQQAAKDTTIKMFPTYKLFFLEEDKGIFRNFDDYYTHNAIQSIEVVHNKNSASKTAILRLSNITNSLTDPLSFHREKSDWFKQSSNEEPDDIFFGTLDIKPGTSIVVKMGYAPNDQDLSVIFQGRIIEMNAGPVVQIVAQSYGAQLNHHIEAEKFGLLSTVKEHGDVASSVLDTIPGLEKLGKIPMFGLTTNDFTGKNLRNVRGNIGDRFLMGNLLGHVSALTFAQDNPRDENIYLPYSVVGDIYHRPTFDWTVFDQTVWESLDEISNYHRNVVPIVRDYNDDKIAYRSDLRETIIVGDKGGFYKFTDSFGLSSLNIKEVSKAAQDWATAVQPLENIRDTSPFNERWEDTGGGGRVLISATLKSEYKPLFLFLQKRINALVIAAHVLNNTQGVGSIDSVGDLVTDALFNNKFFTTRQTDFVEKIIEFSKLPEMNEIDIPNYNFALSKELGDYTYQSKAVDPRYQSFQEIPHRLKGLFFTGEERIPWSFSAEEYYQVRDSLENTDQKLYTDPRYKKVQTHHLITDTSDILSNNIALSTSFNNMVNVYYTGEPSIKASDPTNMKEAWLSKNLHVWSVKAFGDTRDEHQRPLNSFQKNIDTNWFDIASATNSFFKGYQRIKRDNDDQLKSNYSKLTKGNGTNTLGIDAPNWDIFPSWMVIGVSLLKKEVEKMYQGTIEIVGNPNIKPYDIIHIQDYTNDMHGTIEVEEVIHTFSPDGGFRTIITPNLITFDRDPIQMQDVQIINQIYDFAQTKRSASIAYGTAALAGTVVSALSIPVNPIISTASILTTAPIAYNGLVNGYKKHHKFLYDMMGNILGRDCINFTALLYHGVPFVAGFDGVDYTNLKTLMNHNVLGVKGPIARYAAFKDPFLANVVTGFQPSEFGIGRAFGSKSPILGRLFTNPKINNNLGITSGL